MSAPETNRIYLGKCEDTMKAWPDNCVDAVVTDPPYELGFMGKSWDSTGIAYSVPMWSEVLRVLKPGGHLLAFSATRTYHRMAVAIEDSGFQIRDQIIWMYGSGFPKSLSIDKAIDNAAGKADERGYIKPTDGLAGGSGNTVGSFTGRQMAPDPVTADAKKWRGWGTALKPAQEPVVLARKPISEKTVAANVLRWGTGALNIDASRIGDDEVGWGGGGGNAWKEGTGLCKDGDPRPAIGRWPANVILDQYTSGLLDAQEPGASRFFYVAKPDGAERNMGLQQGPPDLRPRDEGRQEGLAGGDNPRNRGAKAVSNFHPTVKPVDLMAYLITLITPRGGVVLDPFLGSGTTAIAAARLGNPYLGCEMSAEYAVLAEKRIAAETAQGKLF